MTRSMTRWTLAGCMALGALGAVAGLDVGTATADAAPSVSPFAGTYFWKDAGNGFPTTVTISDGGRISGSYSDGRAKGSVSGRVGDDGGYAFTVSVTERVVDYPKPGGHTYDTYRFEYAGTMAPDEFGNLVGTSATAYGSFVWLRQ
jgi:hypothetical protein